MLPSLHSTWEVIANTFHSNFAEINCHAAYHAVILTFTGEQDLEMIVEALLP